MPNSAPFKEPVFTSLTTSWNFCFPVRFSSISTRIVTARDWVPTFPAISSTNDWKHITMGSTATTFSKSPTTEDTAMPKNSRMISQGSRFFML